jgi:hypothetical protein
MMIPAHGALGSWDEVVFFGVVLVFVAMMVMSWLRDSTTSEEETGLTTDSARPAILPTGDDQRFELK